MRTLVHGLGNDGVSTFCAVCNQDLGGFGIQLLGDLLDLRVVDQHLLSLQTMTERAVSGQMDVVLFAESLELRLLQERMRFNLVDSLHTRKTG